MVKPAGVIADSKFCRSTLEAWMPAGGHSCASAGVSHVVEDIW
jgi:hypothetical protein